MPDKKSPAPKIIQVMTDKDGRLSGVLYSNGRVFLWTWTLNPSTSTSATDKGWGFWAEIAYPDLEIKK
jgi:hypothetical protein